MVNHWNPMCNSNEKGAQPTGSSVDRNGMMNSGVKSRHDPMDKALQIASKLNARAAHEFIKSSVADTRSLGSLLIGDVLAGCEDLVRLNDTLRLEEALRAMSEWDGSVNREVLAHFVRAWAGVINAFSEDRSLEFDKEGFVHEVVLTHLYACHAIRTRRVEEYVSRPGREVRRSSGIWTRSGLLFGIASAVSTPQDILTSRSLGKLLSVPFARYVDRTTFQLLPTVNKRQVPDSSLYYVFIRSTLQPLAILQLRDVEES